MTKPETSAQRMDRLRRESAARIAAMRADRAQRLSEIAGGNDSRKAEWDLQQQLQREEAAERQKTADAIEIAYQRVGRDFRQHVGLRLTEAQRSEEVADLVESAGLHRNDPKVVRLRAWVAEQCQGARIEVREDASPILRNGAAIRSLRRVIIAPVQSLETAAVAAHEVGHVLCPETAPDAPKTKTATGTVCVSSELLAWQWVLDHIPVWEAPMRQRMRECLDSYRQYATDAEQRQIDDLISDNTFRVARLGAMTRQLEQDMQTHTGGRK